MRCNFRKFKALILISLILNRPIKIDWTILKFVYNNIWGPCIMKPPVMYLMILLAWVWKVVAERKIFFPTRPASWRLRAHWMQQGLGPETLIIILFPKTTNRWCWAKIRNIYVCQLSLDKLCWTRITINDYIQVNLHRKQNWISSI